MNDNEFFLFPRGRARITALSTAPFTIFTEAHRVRGIVLTTVTAATVIFRAIDDVPEYFRYTVPANTSVFLDIGFFAEEGLEILTAAASGNTDVTVFWVKLS